MPSFKNLFDRFYDNVLLDPILEPVFKYMMSEHRQQVAYFVAEVLSGPKLYSEDGGSHSYDQPADDIFTNFGHICSIIPFDRN